MTTTLEDKHFEKRFIIGTLALDSNLDLAAEARVLLDVPESVSECAKLTQDCRALFGDANPVRRRMSLPAEPLPLPCTTVHYVPAPSDSNSAGVTTTNPQH